MLISFKAEGSVSFRLLPLFLERMDLAMDLAMDLPWNNLFATFVGKKGGAKA